MVVILTPLSPSMWGVNSQVGILMKIYISGLDLCFYSIRVLQRSSVNEILRGGVGLLS
jgi:hypothetical protein